MRISRSVGRTHFCTSLTPSAPRLGWRAIHEAMRDTERHRQAMRHSHNGASGSTTACFILSDVCALLHRCALIQIENTYNRGEHLRQCITRRRAKQAWPWRAATETAHVCEIQFQAEMRKLCKLCCLTKIYSPVNKIVMRSLECLYGIDTHTSYPKTL